MAAPKGFTPINGFKKGQSGNPSGKKILPEKRKVINLAEYYYEQFYEALKEKALVDKEAWAMRLSFDHLPKKIREPTERFIIKQDTTSVETQIESLRLGLGEIEDHDVDNATTIIKTLSSTKVAERTALTEGDVTEDRQAMLAKMEKGLEMLDKLESKRLCLPRRI